MDQTTIDAVYDWLSDHPDHVDCAEKRVCTWLFQMGNSERTFHRYMSEPEILADYSDPSNHEMEGPKVENGCDYIFRMGSRKSDRCNVATKDGETRCEFHDHVIFRLLNLATQ